MPKDKVDAAIKRQVAGDEALLRAYYARVRLRA